MNERERGWRAQPTDWEPAEIAWLITDGGVSHIDHLTSRTGMTRFALEAALRRAGYGHLVTRVPDLSKPSSSKVRRRKKISQ